MDFYVSHNCRPRLPPREALVGDFEVDWIQSVFRGVINIEVHPTDQKPNLDDAKNSIIFSVPKDPVSKSSSKSYWLLRLYWNRYEIFTCALMQGYTFSHITSDQLEFKLGLSSYEIENHLVKHSPDTSEGAYSMLLSWISRVKDRQVAHQKLREALKEAALNLYNSEVLASQSQVEHNDNNFWNLMFTLVLICVSAFLLGKWRFLF